MRAESSVQFEEVEDAITGEIELRRRPNGRPFGSKNREKTVEEKLEAIGCDPIVGLARLAVKAEALNNDVLAMKGYAELAQYQHAKKKSVEITLSPDDPLGQALQLSSAERMLRVTQLLTQLGAATK